MGAIFKNGTTHLDKCINIQKNNSDNSKMQQRRSVLLNINLYQVNYKNILDLNCWLTIISKMLTKFIAFLVTNRLHTMNLTGRELTTLKKHSLQYSKFQLAKSASFNQLINALQKL